MDNIRDTIARVAAEEGIDPAYALAVAERESSFNPNARASKSIAGLFQMTGGLRHQYGVGDSSDPETQTRAFARFTKDLQGEMKGQLGRDPSNAETYLGHFWGGARAARVVAGHHAGLAPSDLFSPRELAENPELARGSSAGGLAGKIMGDINRRQAKYGGNGDKSTGNGDDFAAFGQASDDQLTGGSPPLTGGADFASFGRPEPLRSQTGEVDKRPGTEIDLAQFGTPAKEPDGPDFSQFGGVQQVSAKVAARQPAKPAAENFIADTASRMPEEIPPDAVLAGKGIAPSRKHGDAIDYNSTDIMRSKMFDEPQWNI